MCLTLRVVIKALLLLICLALCVMFQLWRAAHQLLGCLHTLLSFRPSGEHKPEEVVWPGITLKDGSTMAFPAHTHLLFGISKITQ